MPNETFFNLPKEKQKRILKAAKKEFSQSALKDASIANVVKEADISRGSFYQYFEDMEDLYLYYFHSLGKDNHKQFLIRLRQHQGDLFTTFEEFFSNWIEEIFNGENVLFYKNLFTSLDPRAIHRFITFNEANQQKELRKTSDAAHEKMQEITKAMLKEVDQTKLAVVDDQQLELLFRLLIHITFSTIADGYHHHSENGKYDIQKINEEFHLKLNWLQKGMETNERGNHR